LFFSRSGTDSVLRKIQLFAAVFFDLSIPDVTSSNIGGLEATKSLISLLKDLLAKFESYQVLSFAPSASDMFFLSNNTDPSSQLMKQIRVSLQPKDPESVQPNYRSGLTVNVYAVTTISQLKEFLKKRVQFVKSDVKAAAVDTDLEVEGNESEASEVSLIFN
jgi:hypothetical protein